MEKNLYLSAARLCAIEEGLEKLKADLRTDQKKNLDQLVIDNYDFIKLFKISSRTARYWRSQKKISYSRVGKQILYRLSDVQAMIEKFRVEN